MESGIILHTQAYLQTIWSWLNPWAVYLLLRVCALFHIIDKSNSSDWLRFVLFFILLWVHIKMVTGIGSVTWEKQGWSLKEFLNFLSLYQNGCSAIVIKGRRKGWIAYVLIQYWLLYFFFSKRTLILGRGGVWVFGKQQYAQLRNKTPKTNKQGIKNKQNTQSYISKTLLHLAFML